MEFLIPGLILVAFMAWASTRIKKNAAAAFDAETIETDDFTVRKPEGFLHVLNDNSGLAFRAYSKEFGKVGRQDVRQATVEVSIREGESIESRRNAIEAEAESIISETPYIDAGEKALIIESKRVDNGAEFYTVDKLVTRGSRVIEMRISVLSEHREENSAKIDILLDSFQPK